VELGPEDLSSYQFLSGCLSRWGQDDELVEVARNGLAVYPFDAILRYGLGVALTRKGDLAGAASQFSSALLLQPGWADAHLNLGRTFIRLGNVPEGLRHLREAVRLAPGLPRALNELAWLLATSSDASVRNGPEAIQLARQACAATGGRDPALLNTLAAAYAENGEFPQAVAAIQDALRLARTNGNAAAAARGDILKACFESGRPYREKAGPLP